MSQTVQVRRLRSRLPATLCYQLDDAGADGSDFASAHFLLSRSVTSDAGKEFILDGRLSLPVSHAGQTPADMAERLAELGILQEQPARGDVRSWLWVVGETPSVPKLRRTADLVELVREPDKAAVTAGMAAVFEPLVILDELE